MRTRLVLIGLAVACLVVAVTAFVIWKRGQVPVGSDEQVTISSGIPSGYVWVDPSRGHRWCLALGETFPAATGEWDDGVLHSGRLASGTLHFDSDMRATFRGDVDGAHHPVALVRMTTNRYGCHYE